MRPAPPTYLWISLGSPAAAPRPATSARATRSRAAASVASPIGKNRLEMPADVVVDQIGDPGAADGLDGGEDAPLEIRPAGAEILVGGVKEGLQRRPHRLVAAHVPAEALLQRVARVLAPGALGEVVRLLVPAAGDVVLEQPAHPRPLVEAGEDGDDHQALHGHGQVGADHGAEPI